MQNKYNEYVQSICDYALEIIKKGKEDIKKLHFRPMKRLNDRVNTKRGYIIGRTNLKTGLITIDIYTAKFRKPKALASILRILSHEIAHHQKPPYRSRFRGRLIIRKHYPVFYRQVKRNIKKLQNNNELKKFFNKL